MKKGKKGQISTEYLIVMGFVTFMVISLMGIAFLYVGQIRDNMKMNQINTFGKKIVNSAETVYFAGNPSRATVLLNIPQGVQNIVVAGAEDKQLVVYISTDTGLNILSFSSDVPLEISTSLPINYFAGVKRIRLEAKDDKVVISQV